MSIVLAKHLIGVTQHPSTIKVRVVGSRNSSADARFTQGLVALMQPIICCVRAQSAREFVTEFSGGATPHRSGVGVWKACGSELEL